LAATFFTMKMISLYSLTPKTQIKTPNSSSQDRFRWSYVGHKDAAAILDAVLNYTFCPISGMSTQVFFNLLWVPYRDQESKLGDI